ncbi:LacI family DNA-binding transcriptional regulator [Cryptosporangium aurantiacum]|uniref:Transcriptional regulator, LacI family n=1 Tax=Cryptosporangium aurantiacum TaxID=134849 RepID=A0A1M7RI54_9ACTN|nr:transcriptional regulator, LacI family [Cryptosporangium aurantiacum]
MSNAYGVAPSTRARVLRIAEELDYVVSPEASRLARGAVGRVALVVPHVDRWFFGAVVSGLEAELSDAGMDVLLYHVGDADDRRDFFHRLPARRKVDAVVVVAFAVAETEQRRLERMGVLIVAAGGQNAVYPSVHIDDREAGRQALDHLLFLGHRRIAMISAVDPDEDAAARSTGRDDAYHDALRDAGLSVDDSLVRTIDWSGVAAADAMATLLSLHRPPTAVYCHCDELALGAIRTIRRAGLRVPEDLSVIGIDDHPLAELTDLTTIAQPAREQGVRTAHLLLALLRQQPVERHVVVPTRLVIRRSTAPPRSG